MVNLCNGGTKYFVELWEIIHLNIWTQLTSSNTFKPAQTTNRYYLMQPATTFLTPKWKKICRKQQLQNFIQRRNAKKT